MSTSDRDLAIIARLADAIRAIEPTAVILIPTAGDTAPSPEPAPTPAPSLPDRDALMRAALGRLNTLAMRSFTLVDAVRMPDGTPLPQLYFSTQPDDSRDWVGELENELAESMRKAVNDGGQFLLADPARPMAFGTLGDGSVELSAAFAIQKNDPAAPVQPAEEQQP